MTSSETQNTDTSPQKQPPSCKFATWNANGFGAELVAVAAGGKNPMLPGWQTKTASAQDIKDWDAAGYNLGIRTRDFPFMDVDCDDPDTAKDIAEAISRAGFIHGTFLSVPQAARAAVPHTCIRTRKGTPRFGLLFQLARGEPRFKKFKRVWTRTVTNGASSHVEKFEIEILSDGQQFVAEGKHPDGEVYAWPGGLPLADKLPVVKRSDFTPWLDEIDQVVRKRGWNAQKQRPASSSAGAGTSALGVKCPAGLEHLVSGMFAAIPNDLAVDYDQWIALGIAARAAGDFFDEWDVWSAKNVINEDAKDNRVTWDGFAPVGDIGFGTLVREAELAGWIKPVELLDHYRQMKQTEQEKIQARPWEDFDVVDSADTDRGAKVTGSTDGSKSLELRPGWLAVAGDAIPDPWLYGEKLMRGEITLLAGRGGVSKSTLALGWCMDICLDQASPLLGNVVRERGLRCAFINADDSAAKTMKRVKAACKRRGVDIATLDERFWFMSANDLPAKWNLSDGASRRALMSAMQATNISVLVIDPLANVAGVDENSNTEMVGMMHALAKLAQARGLAVCLVHHERKGGVDDEDGTQLSDNIRGASAIIGRVRIALQLRPMNETDRKSLGVGGPVSIKSMVRLDATKENYARSGKDAEWYAIESVSMGDIFVGFFSEPVHVSWNRPVGSVSSSAVDMVLAVLVAGVPSCPGSLWSSRPCPDGSLRNLIEVMSGVTDAPLQPVEVRTILDTLVREGKIVEVRYNDKYTKNKTWGWEVVKSL